MFRKCFIMSQKIRVALVDDHQVIRSSWKLLFDTDPRFVVVALCRNGQEAIDAVRELRPDVFLMDINMTPLNGFDTTERILQIDPLARVIGISANVFPGYAKKIMDLGAKGFVTKSSGFRELTGAVVTVHEGGTYVCREILDNCPEEDL